MSDAMGGRVGLAWVRHRPVLLVRVDMMRPTLNLGHVLLVSRSSWEDVPIVRHQMTHIEQLMDLWYVGHLFMWLVSRRFRLWMDADAYRVELACCEAGNLDSAKTRIAQEMAERHGISISRARGILALTRGCPL